jgi:hypothetical protein
LIDNVRKIPAVIHVVTSTLFTRDGVIHTELTGDSGNGTMVGAMEGNKWICAARVFLSCTQPRWKRRVSRAYESLMQDSSEGTAGKLWRQRAVEINSASAGFWPDRGKIDLTSREVCLNRFLNLQGRAEPDKVFNLLVFPEKLRCLPGIQVTIHDDELARLSAALSIIF